MSRNNEARAGVKKPTSDLPMLSNESSSDSFSFAIPTEFVSLPSRGKFYPEGHPLSDKDVVEIKFMTAKEEDILSSRSLLKKGIAVDRFLQAMLIDKNVRVDDLLIGDKNAVIIAARITGYGEDYVTKVVCPVCTTSTEYEFSLEKVAINYGGLESVDGLDVTNVTENTFLVPLPKSKLNVEVKFLISSDEDKLVKLAESKRKNRLPETPLTDQLKSFIISVNNNTEPALISEFVDNMPAIDSKYLRKIYRNLTPNVDLTQEFACNTCDHVENMEVPLTADFFWSK